ncbi:16S rRNA (cytosine(967)-C(5))-methyltransferase RsmB [Amphibacillus xylanus]|uniref:16S rRNA (cytosine(967)-C(5))-methyltransferase n=1 Tax=Amphibacillus xylanus (strain ATCC 51415 / DSM 6626 / JCM 7361 / LMG 17667 / NBRC 15112 / Ep01) TaxID=698758 RepID=K0J3H4_AMPXN|nr:16S rRNA (cytosine(967)-C(5))-methyltransferase RsmB [Amphibacillus xylanus]BAM47677.1 putative rRNA methyltransferase [Amphibacillus xylanus NBRC 15112]
MSKFQLRTKTLDVLVKIGDSGAFSHLTIDQTIEKMDWAHKDQALFTELVYGTLQRKLTLDYFLNHFVDPNKKVEKWVKWLLYLSFYQMHYLDKIPDHAIIHEAVEIAKQKGHQGIAKFVNGVLREAQRQGFPLFDTIKDPIERLSIETSHPYWLVERWIDSYGEEQTEAMCKANLETKPISVRVNSLKLTRDEAIEQLTHDGFEVKASLFSNQGIIIEKGHILDHPLFKSGSLTIQDQSSMLVVEMLDIKQDQIVLDACSAPGGKATHIGEKLNNTGRVYAYDLHQKKVNLVKRKAEQLGLINISTAAIDGRQLNQKYEPETFDRILVDAPCSGFGVIRTKPDIKYAKTAKDVDNLAHVQYELLEKIAPLLKKNGKLLYSTCTVDPTENEVVVTEFLINNQRYEVDPDFFKELPEFLNKEIEHLQVGIQIFPNEFNSDGFFLTRIRRKQDED